MQLHGLRGGGRSGGHRVHLGGLNALFAQRVRHHHIHIQPNLLTAAFFARFHFI